jgi:HEPN domain-containing protein
LEDLCFNAQQAAEKAFKAICIARNIDFPKTHSLVRLIDIIEEQGMSIPESIKAADILTQYAVQSRYPDWIEEIRNEEYSEALKLSAQVVFWAEKYLSTKE